MAENNDALLPDENDDLIELVDEYVIRMMSGGFAAFVELDLKQADAIFSDNFFVPCTAEEAADPVSLPDLAALYSALMDCFCFHLENQLVFACSC